MSKRVGHQSGEVDVFGGSGLNRFFKIGVRMVLMHRDIRHNRLHLQIEPGVLWFVVRITE